MARGTATVAYREVEGQPWIGIPGIATKGDVDQMFKDAGLADWNIQKREIITDSWTDSPDFEIVRNREDGTSQRLHISKTRYHVWDNEQVRDFAKNTAFGSLEPVAAGALRNGRQVFMSFKIGDDITIAGTDDTVEHFLNVRTSHDGSWAFGINLGLMRLRCQNMLNSVRSHALSSYTIRHTSSMDGKVEEARKALGLSVRQSEVFAQDMAALATEDLTDSKFWDLVKTIYPEPKADVRGAKAKWEFKTDQIMSLWNGETVANLDKNKYRAYNALNEHLRWYSTVRADDVEGALARAGGFDDVANKADVRLYKAVLAF